jgi:tRNA G18 (ribose-2'-O)-methylase SpoU
MGHVLGVPFTSLQPWPAGLKLLADRGFRVLAMTPADDALPLTPDLAGERVAVLLGSEGPGLTPEAVAAADAAVRIPMAGEVDSLNVATAGAVAFYALGGAGR